jgi:hypothetical protein
MGAYSLRVGRLESNLPGGMPALAGFCAFRVSDKGRSVPTTILITPASTSPAIFFNRPPLDIACISIILMQVHTTYYLIDKS